MHFEVDVNVRFSQDPETTRLLNLVLAKLEGIKIKEDKMDADIQAIIDQATANENTEAAANAALVALFTSLQAAIAASASLSPADRATLQAKVTEMKASSATLAAAIVANPAA